MDMGKLSDGSEIFAICPVIVVGVGSWAHDVPWWYFPTSGTDTGHNMVKQWQFFQCQFLEDIEGYFKEFVLQALYGYKWSSEHIAV